MEIGFLWIAKKQAEWIGDEMSGDKPHQKDPKPKMYLLGYVTIVYQIWVGYCRSAKPHRI